MKTVRPALFAVAIAAASIAQAQTDGSLVPAAAGASPASADLLGVFERLDGTALGLIAVAVLIVLLLVWRIAVMVRRERPVSVPAVRARSRRSSDDDPLDQSTLSQPTDWGFDQNKRAALARSPVVVEEGNTALPSLEAAITQWSETDKQNAMGMQAEDSLGRSPLAPPPSPYRTGFNPYFTPERQPENRIEVEEVADTLMQAELLVQLGDPKQAMNLLSQHIRDTEKPGPAVWLMLLNLYQSTGREAQYNALSSGFQILFNAEVPPWASATPSAMRDLESYAPVLARLQANWTNGQPRALLEGLLTDNRGGSRQGFTLTAYREILFLVEILNVLEQMEVEEEERRGIQEKLGR